MSLSINVSLNRRASQDPRSSIYSINVTTELDVSLLTRPKELQERIAGLYSQAAQAIDLQADAPIQPAAVTASAQPGGTNEKTIPDRMSRQQAADYIGVKVQTLAVWATTGRYSLPFVRVGRRAVYNRADLDRWMAERTSTSTGSIKGEPRRWAD